ncbi:MAG: chromosome segregation protein SMC, partial [Candidatus Nanopelagicaceae bacterium]
MNGVPTGLTSLLSKCRSKTLESLLPTFLDRVVIAQSLNEAEEIIKDHPDLIAVTARGELLSRSLARGGSGNSLVQINHLIETTTELVDHLSHERDRLRFDVSTLDDEVAKARAANESALARLNESDSKMAAIAEAMAAIGQTLTSARDEKGRLEQQIAVVDSSLTKLGEELERAKVDVASEVTDAMEPDTTAMESLRAELARIRGTEVDARLELRTAEERVTALVARIKELKESAQRERESASRQIARREARGRGALIAQEIAETAYEALIQIEVSISRAATERERLEISRSDREGETLALRARIRELGVDLEELTSSVHQDEIAKAEQRLRIEQLEAKALEEFGIDRDILIAEYGPENLVSTFSENEFGEVIASEPMPFKREAQERRLAQAERSLALLGRINPLALEEYSALEERLKYLADQMEDLKKSRKDLMDIIKEVDDKVLEIF